MGERCSINGCENMKFKLIVKVVPDIEVTIEASDPCVCLNVAGRCIVALREKGFDPKLDFCPIEGLILPMRSSLMHDVNPEATGKMGSD